MSLTAGFQPLPLSLPSLRPAASTKYPLELKVFAPSTDKREIYQLRYRAFSAAELITLRDDELFSDSYDELETTCILGAFAGTVCVGSFRLTFGHGRPGEHSMPCQTIFPEVGALERRGFKRIVEFTRMVVAPELTNMSYRTTLYATLVRAGLIVAHAARTDFGLIAVNPGQVRFYEAMCGFSEMARGDCYPGINAPAVLLGRAFCEIDKKRAKQNPFFKIAAHEVSRVRAQLFPEAALASA